MSESEFARNQLKKHGWSEGSGLGKDETGMKDAIKVKIKNNKTGIGHDPGAEFTTSWWQDVFNKTANSIQVEASQDGEVTVKRLEEKKKKKKEIESRKTALYGRFVKAATLTQEGGRSVEKVDADRSSSSSDDEDEDKSLRPSEEAVYKQCEGRTAHKGARHGLGLSGKLQRVEEMERDLLEKMTRSQHGSKEKKKKREKANEDSDKDVGQSREMEMISEEESVLVRKKSKKKKKLNKSSDDEVDLNGEMEQDNFSEDLGQETNDLRNKSKKKKKKKDKEIEFESDCVDKKRTHEESDCEQGDEIRKKSKKKKKEKENDNHIVEETENIDITNSESSKKKKKKKKRSEQD